MLKDKLVAVVVPAYNEEKQISMVIETIPEFVDRIIIVNDGSVDKTEEIAKQFIDNNDSTIKIENSYKNLKTTKYNFADLIVKERLEKEKKSLSEHRILNANPETSKVILISLKKNSGVGSSVAIGYKWCKDNGIDCTVKIDGDGQMDPEEIKKICLPIINNEVDYVKGNRLIHQASWVVIPKIRFLGNSILSILTKIASGYWHISDTQTAFTAISKQALNSIGLSKIYKGYGYPNDLLVKLNIAFCTIREVEIKPIYNVGEKSKMRILTLIPKISWLLFKSFFKRLWIKYFFRDFHPLFILYHFAIALLMLSVPYGFKILKITFAGDQVNPVTLIVFVLLFISGFQSLLFAMWMDIQDNERLNK